MAGGVALVIACGDDGEPPVAPGTPSGVTAVNGLYYKAIMGSSSVDNPIEFTVADEDSNPMPNQWVRFSILEGDGTLSSDSLATDSVGTVTAEYTFDGALGRAEIMATVRNVDSVAVSVRANTLIPGIDGQAQYVLFNDHYSDVKDFNGNPASVDPDPVSWILYANYEAALGVVVVIDDLNQDSVAVDEADVLGVIVNTVYTGKTADSIGIGSAIADVRAAYGAPDTVRYDPTDPPAVYIRYNGLGLTFYGDLSADTTVFEIHLSENVPGSDVTGETGLRAGAVGRRPDWETRGYKAFGF